MNSQFWWYATRASGIVAWLLLTSSVLWGVVLSTKAFPEQRRPAWLLDLHRWLGGLTVAFVAFHITSLIADSYVSFGPADVAIPFVSNWKPLPVALGIVAAWGLLAVELTSLAMRRLPKKVWRAVHFSSYLIFWLTTLHAAFAGSDTSQAMYQLTGAASIVAVAWATIYRLTHRKPVRQRPVVPGRSSSGGDRRVDPAADRGPGKRPNLSGDL